MHKHVLHFHIWWAKLNPHMCQSWLIDCEPLCFLAITSLTHHGLLISLSQGSPVKPTQTSFLLRTGFLFSPSFPLSTNCMCVIEACTYHRFIYFEAVLGFEGCLCSVQLGGRCVGCGVGSMECIKSHVNKRQLDSQWNSWRECSSPCRSVGCVNIVSTVADWGEEEMEPSLWAATRIILVAECTQNQFQHGFTLYNHSCLTASMLTNITCQSKHVVNHNLWTKVNI